MRDNLKNEKKKIINEKNMIVTCFDIVIFDLSSVDLFETKKNHHVSKCL